jgi:hypothetical protein
MPEVRKGQGDMQISRDLFRERFRERFYDPEFEPAAADIDRLADIAWQAYHEARKSPRTRAAGAGFADPSMELSVQWLATRDAIAAAQREHDDPHAKSRVLLSGWPYPRHLQGRAYSVIVHGDAQGAETLRRSLGDWLSDMQLVSAGPAANFDRYVGYYEPYATSHDALDEDAAIHEEVRNAARALLGKVRELRGGLRFDEQTLQDPRPK